MTLEAARAGFSQKQANVLKQEEARDTQAQVQLAGAPEAAARDFANCPPERCLDGKP
jgi:hypothetical protein